MVFTTSFPRLEKGIRPADVKVSLNSTELKVMHGKWISKLYDYLCAQDEIILNGFKAAGITEVVESANAVLERIENPFRGKIFVCFNIVWTLASNFAC